MKNISRIPNHNFDLRLLSHDLGNNLFYLEPIIAFELQEDEHPWPIPLTKPNPSHQQFVLDMSTKIVSGNGFFDTLSIWMLATGAQPGPSCRNIWDWIKYQPSEEEMQKRYLKEQNLAVQ